MITACTILITPCTILIIPCTILITERMPAQHLPTLHLKKRNRNLLDRSAVLWSLRISNEQTHQSVNLHLSYQRRTAFCGLHHNRLFNACLIVFEGSIG